MTLRRRLIATVIVLVAVGLAAVDIITLTELHSYLYGRVDDQLSAAADVVSDYVQFVDARGLRPTLTGIDVRVSAEIYVDLLDATGQVVLTRPSGTGSQYDPAPRLPSSIPVRSESNRGRRLPPLGIYRPDESAVDVPSVERHGPEYRALATSVPGGTAVVATRLDAVNATLTSLRTIELAVSLGVIAALGAVLATLIRLGLRPLFTMASDADAIAEGDLTRRVHPADPETEIGRLGRALNGMLEQIEAAFAQRTRSEERLRRFMTDASHELRTPLTTIRGYAELLRKDALGSEEAVEQALERIESEAARMGVLVDDLLTLARLGEESESPSSVIDLVAGVAGTVADAQMLQRTHPIELHALRPVYVRADAPRIGQIVHNLLTNAVIHTPAGTEIEVDVDVVDNHAVLRVADRGPGMTAADAARVFDRFYRGAAPDGRGSGLGLFIVAALVQALGGSVSVDTALGRGSTFEVALPLEDRPPSGSALASPSSADPSSQDPR